MTISLSAASKQIGTWGNFSLGTGFLWQTWNLEPALSVYRELVPEVQAPSRYTGQRMTWPGRLTLIADAYDSRSPFYLLDLYVFWDMREIFCRGTMITNTCLLTALTTTNKCQLQKMHSFANSPSGSPGPVIEEFCNTVSWDWRPIEDRRMGDRGWRPRQGWD